MIIDRGRKLQQLYEGVFHDVLPFQNHVDNQLYNYCNSAICLSVAKNVLNTTFELVNLGRPFLRRMRF